MRYYHNNGDSQSTGLIDLNLSTLYSEEFGQFDLHPPKEAQCTRSFREKQKCCKEWIQEIEQIIVPIEKATLNGNYWFIFNVSNCCT